jgi:hypothetical protein
MKKHKNIFVTSLLLTVLIFITGILMNYGLDFVRINVISDVMLSHELSTESYVIEQEFINTFGGVRCDVMNKRISALKEEIRQVGADLGSYSRFSFFKKKDFDYLKRKYFLLELEFLNHIDKLNKECGQSVIPVVFFYEIDQDDSERQGFVLQEVSKAFEDSVVVITLDKDYEDEPLVELLALKYTVTQAPAVIINGVKRQGMIYDKELSAIIRGQINGKDKEILQE